MRLLARSGASPVSLRPAARPAGFSRLTTRLNEPYINNTGVPMGSMAKLVERFSPSADGSRLSYTIVVTDPDSLTAPVEGKRSWVWRPDEKVMPFNCTANAR